MKKGFISALFMSLMLAVPAIALAEENEESLHSFESPNVLAETVQEFEPLKVESTTEVKAASVPVTSATEVETSQTQKQSKGLLNIGLGLPIVGEVKIDLLAEEKAKSESEESTSTQNRLLGVEIKNSELLGNVSLEVLKKDEQDEREVSSSGLVSLDVDNALLGKTHIGVLEGNKNGSSDKADISANLVVIESKDSLLGNARVGVGEYKKENGQRKVKLANVGSFNDPADIISEPDTDFGQPVIPKQPAGQESKNDKADESLNSSNEKPNGSLNGNADPEEQGVEDSTNDHEDHLLNEDVAAIAGVNGVAGQDRILKQDRNDVIKEYEKIIDKVNKSETNTIKIVSASGVAPSSGASGASGGSGTASSSGASGFAAYMAVDFINEIESCCHAMIASEKLSDQWDKSPPSDPPRAAFFLNV